MDQRDRVRLDSLLRDLMDAQDTVTHINESGSVMGLLSAKQERKAIREKIMRFVEQRTLGWRHEMSTPY